MSDIYFNRSCDSCVDIVTGYGLEARVLFPAEAQRRLIQTPIQWSLSRAEGRDWGVNLSTHLHIVPPLRVVELYFHSPICLHAI
jgi:hypothetical protein